MFTVITEETMSQAIFDYATEKYGDRVEELYQRFGAEFPEKDWNIPDDAWEKNYLCWLFFEKVLPETGMTIAEEFAEASKDMAPRMKQNILQMRNMIRSNFAVISGKGQSLKIKDLEDQNVYAVTLPREVPSIPPNKLLTGRIHPFGDHYRFIGIFLIKTTPLILDPEILKNAYETEQVKRSESIQLRKGSTFQSVLNKYPSHWIDWMCTHYRIKERLKKDKIRKIENKLTAEIEIIVNGLSEQSKDALRLCLAHGGFVKYGMLKDFDDDIGFFWDEEKYKSPIAELRQKGLLFVGKMGFGDRNYKIAFVPGELRDGMRSGLSSRATQTILG
ncbi:MAG: hypothetical protein Q7J68_07615 [Thermoplasmata archaeon]|nr:hypothetical protein [Thermoplasmata archaeon]